MDPSARAAERAGDTIAGKYRLERLLGAGGMGAVYEALHEFTQRRVAVKLMHPGFARSAVAAERFLREAQAPSAIGHPGIVEVLDGGRDRDGSLYLVLELLQGRTLAQAIAQRALDARQIGAVGLSLLSALQAAHDAGFVHRDIKPENVFLVGAGGGEPQVKLLDFGIAGVLSAEAKPGLTQAGSVLGTPLYMSPEQALGRRVDARSDLWSVGAVLYQALSGRAPFSGESFQALVVSISTQEHLPLSVPCPELPLRLVTVIERALHKDVAQRWQSAAEMADALRRALEDGQRMRPSPDRGLLRPSVITAVRDASGTPRGGVPLWRIGVTVAVLGIAGAALALLPRAPAGTQSDGRRDERAPHHARDDARPERSPANSAVGEIAEASAEAESARAEQAPATEDAPPPARSAQLPYAAPDPRGNAEMDHASHGLAPDTLMTVMRKHDSELQRCYEADVLATLVRPDGAVRDVAPAQLDVQLEVAGSGEVTHVRVEGTASASLRDCTSAAIRAWRFPNSAGPTRARFPLVFRPSIIQP